MTRTMNIVKFGRRPTTGWLVSEPRIGNCDSGCTKVVKKVIPELATTNRNEHANCRFAYSHVQFQQALMSQDLNT